jgi:hypothetical protein
MCRECNTTMDRIARRDQRIRATVFRPIANTIGAERGFNLYSFHRHCQCTAAGTVNVDDFFPYACWCNRNRFSYTVRVLKNIQLGILITKPYCNNTFVYLHGCKPSLSKVFYVFLNTYELSSYYAEMYGKRWTESPWSALRSDLFPSLISYTHRARTFIEIGPRTGICCAISSSDFETIRKKTSSLARCNTVNRRSPINFNRLLEKFHPVRKQRKQVKIYNKPQWFSQANTSIIPLVTEHISKFERVTTVYGIYRLHANARPSITADPCWLNFRCIMLLLASFSFIFAFVSCLFCDYTDKIRIKVEFENG